MATTLSSLYDEVRLEIADKSDGTVEEGDMLKLIDRVSKRLQARDDFLAVKNRSTLELLDTAHEYTIPTDFKELVDFYDNTQTIDVESVSADQFWDRKHVFEDRILFAKEGLLGTETLLVKDNRQTALILNGASSLTENGTWASVAGTDAENLTQDTVNFKYGNASINFDITVANSVNDYGEIQNSTMTATNLTEHKLLSTMLVWVYLPTSVTSLTLKWGSDSSNYWSKTETTQHSGTDFVVGWNLLGFDWNSATETGTVDETAINFLNFRVTYTAAFTNQTDFRIDFIRSAIPRPLDIHYYSSYIGKDSSGSLLTTFTDSSDVTLWKNKYDLVLVKYVAAEALNKILDEPNKAAIVKAEADEDYKEFLSKEPSDRKWVLSEY